MSFGVTRYLLATAKPEKGEGEETPDMPGARALLEPHGSVETATEAWERLRHPMADAFPRLALQGCAGVAVPTQIVGKGTYTLLCAALHAGVPIAYYDGETNAFYAVRALLIQDSQNWSMFARILF